MLDLGFRPAVDRIVNQVRQERQTLFFSATLDGEVNRIATKYTRDAVRVEHHTPEAEIGHIEHRFMTTRHDEKLDRLVDVLAGERELALVFVRTKRGASRLAMRLEHRGVRVAALHGDMTQSQRTRSLERFSRGHADTLVATDVAARGLDIDAITHVVNFDPPDDDPSYVHRSGRTGRAGRSGTSITLVLDDQREAVSKMAVLAGVDEPRCERTDTPLMVPGPAQPGQQPRAPQAAADGAAAPRRPSGRVAPRPAAQPRPLSPRSTRRARAAESISLRPARSSSFSPQASNGTIAKRSTSTSPWSVILSAGITESARKLSVMNGAASVEPELAHDGVQVVELLDDRRRPAAPT